MFASTYRLIAGPLPPGPLLPEVERVTSAEDGVPLPAKCQTTSAFAVITASDTLLTWNVQVAVLPFCCGEPQVLFRIGVTGDTLGVIEVIVGVVPAGLATLVTVNVCRLVTSFTPFGVMLTFASTNSLTAGPELPCVESVVLVTSVELAPDAKCQTAVAVAVNVPGVGLLIVTVHVRVLPLPLGTHAVWLAGAGDTFTVREVSEAVDPAGSAFVVIVNVCA